MIFEVASVLKLINYIDISMFEFLLYLLALISLNLINPLLFYPESK